MLPPGFLSKSVKGIEREKQQTIQKLLEGMRAAGIENPSKFLFGSNKKSNGKGTDERKNKIGRGDGDEDYEPFNGEEGLSDDDDNDDFSRSKKKVKSTAVGKKNSGSTTQEEGSNPHEATQALQLPTSPTEQTDPFSSPHTVVGSLARTRSDKPIRKRGPTKLKTIAIDGGSRIKVSFDENGLPIGEESIKLSSFYGALVREIVPYTLSDWRKLPSGMAEVLWQSIQVRFELDQEWQREHVFQRMNESWRAAKSILVSKVNAASNEEERLKLQPANIKSLHEWKDFVKEKTSAKFKAKSNNFKGLRNKQLKIQHTMSRKGYARLTAEMKAKRKSTSRVDVWAEGHRRKIGKPVNKDVENKIDQNAATTEGTPTPHIVSPSRVTTNPNSSTCKLLDWMGTGEVVVEGRWSSSDPNDRVHHIPLGPNAMRVWVDLVKKREVYLWRPTSDMLYLEDAEGTTVAWPADKVLMDSTPGYSC